MTQPADFNLSTVFNTVATAIPDRDLMVWRGRRITYGEMNGRVDGLAQFLVSHGLGCRAKRADLEGYESGQDHVGLLLRNGNEYLEAMIGSYRARAVAINLNYRYAAHELEYLLNDATAKALVYHAEFAPLVSQVLPALADLRLLIQVPDESGNALLPGAHEYEDVVAHHGSASMPTPSGDDLYVLYTGGTTGMPKGVLWRQSDVFVTAMGGTPFGADEPFASYDAIVETAKAGNGSMGLFVIPPFMHGAAQWSAFHAITNGGRIVLADNVHTLDAAQILRAVEQERVMSVPLIGDAMARPLIEELERNGARYDLSGLVAISNGSAPLTPVVRQRLMQVLPHVLLIDSAGASETGIQMSAVAGMDALPPPAVFKAHADTAVVDDLMARVLPPGAGSGWLARTGRIPLGYLGDAEKTARTFPIIDGVRWAIPGDRVRQLPDGNIELLGRDGVTINSGGEKIFAEEVERAATGHPAVRDVIVVGRPSERWGSEVCALVELDDGSVSDDALLADWGTRIARYKLPKTIIRTKIVRSPSGKADYRWARQIAEASATDRPPVPIKLWRAAP